MKKNITQIALTIIGLSIAIFLSAYIADFSDEVFPSYVKGSDDLDRLYLGSVVILIVVFGPLFGYVGYKLGGRLFP